MMKNTVFVFKTKFQTKTYYNNIKVENKLSQSQYASFIMYRCSGFSIFLWKRLLFCISFCQCLILVQEDTVCLYSRWYLFNISQSKDDLPWSVHYSYKWCMTYISSSISSSFPRVDLLFVAFPVAS